MYIAGPHWLWPMKKVISELIYRFCYRSLFDRAYETAYNYTSFKLFTSIQDGNFRPDSSMYVAIHGGNFRPDSSMYVAIHDGKNRQIYYMYISTSTLYSGIPLGLEVKGLSSTFAT